MGLPQDFSRHVKSSADIVRIIGEHVRLKKAGSNFIGLCPFHQEKTPSFSVHATRQFYYCFGCGAKGDVFRFVMETEKVEFPEALKRVAQRCGIPIPVETWTKETASPERRLRASLEEVHRKAQEFYSRQLKSAEAAPVRELIRKRGVMPESVERFGLGFAPGSGSALYSYLTREGFPPDVLEASGLLIRRESGGFFDRFRNRWMFPITSDTGKVVAFGGRALGQDQPKYLNSPETALYTKSRVLYNLSHAREAIRKLNFAVMVEGYMDAIAVHQAGVENVVASCGTALTEPQVRMLARFTADIVVSYDPDSAGVAATDRSLVLLLQEAMSVRVLRLPGGLDPDEFIQQRGAEAYREQLSNAPPFFTYLAARALELHGKATPEAKLAGLNFVLPYLAKVPNKLIRSELVADIAQKMDLGTGIVWESFRNAGIERRESVEKPPDADRIPQAEAKLVRLLFEDAEARRELGALIEQKDLLPELELAGIVRTVLEMGSEEEAPDTASVSDRLDGRQQRILAQVVFDKEAAPGSLSELRTYIAAVERRRLEKRRVLLQRTIAEAQKRRDEMKVLELFREQRELDKQLSRLL